MWIIQYLPAFVTHLIALAGLIGVLLTSITPLWLLFPSTISVWRLPIQVLSIIILCFGIYLEGGQAEAKIWEQRMSLLQTRVDKAEEDAKNSSKKIGAEYTAKTAVTKTKIKTVIEYVDREVIKYDKTCPIPSVIGTAHNAAALNQPFIMPPMEPITPMAPMGPTPPPTGAILLAPRKTK